MKRIEYTHVDKSKWKEGPWRDEPDKVQWQDEATGLPCLINRGPAGAWCGYVGVNSRHPYYEKDYDAVDVEVHGGLTFSSKCQHPEGGQSLACNTICHIVEPDEDDDVWWLGFDCYHAWDHAPGTSWRPREIHDVYRDQAYVTEQVERLAKQLKEMS
jgi:hypothetical protein